MKKLLVGLCAIFICTFAIANTIEWYVDGSLYQTTTCDSGDSITPPTAPEKYGYDFVKWNAGYTQLEYIESTGTQWIDTGLKPNNNWHMVLSYKKPTGTGGTVFGTRTRPSAAAFSITYGDITGKLLLDYGSQRDNSQSITNFYDTKLNVDFDKYNLTVGSYTTHFNTEIFNTEYNQILFGFNNLGTATPAAETIYYCKIYDNDVLVRDFIPAKNSSGVVGMYDTVSGQFFTNQGTGEFIAGPVVGAL